MPVQYSRRLSRSLFAAVVFIPTVLAACSQSEAGRVPDGREVASSSDSVVYVDVRRPDEFEAGHVVNAIHIPHDQMATRWRELETYRDQTIVLYCRTGRRVLVADSVLQLHGFKPVNGKGLDSLRVKGVPVVDRREKLDTGAH